MNIVISNRSKEPIYEQIKKQIVSEILKGNLREEEPLPSIRQLAEDLRVSMITTKKAYAELEREGYINTAVGKGSFVAAHSNDFLKEKRLYIIDKQLRQIITDSRSLGISFVEVIDMLKALDEEVE